MFNFFNKSAVQIRLALNHDGKYAIENIRGTVGIFQALIMLPQLYGTIISRWYEWGDGVDIEYLQFGNNLANNFKAGKLLDSLQDLNMKRVDDPNEFKGFNKHYIVELIDTGTRGNIVKINLDIHGGGSTSKYHGALEEQFSKMALLAVAEILMRPSNVIFNLNEDFGDILCDFNSRIEEQRYLLSKPLLISQLIDLIVEPYLPHLPWNTTNKTKGWF